MSHIVKEGKEKMKEKAMSYLKGNFGMIWNRDLFENLERQNSMAANIDKLMFASGFNPTANLHLKIQVWSLTQLYSGNFLGLERSALKMRVCNKCMIKVCVSCS